MKRQESVFFIIGIVFTAAVLVSMAIVGTGGVQAQISVNPTSTFTLVPPTSTFTPVPPTSTFTPVPPTSTFTPVPPTPTFTPAPPNQPPAADSGGPYLVAAGSTIPLDGSGDDPDEDTLTYAWSSTQPGSSFDDATLEDPTYTAGDEAGIFELTLTVTDPGGLPGSDTTSVVVYDPEDGFVTGGGWIDSPAGAYITNSALTGKATFGFVSKYKKGAVKPSGNTEFQFQAADLNFHSDSYDWLVVNQSSYRAQFKGTGTINGQSSQNGDYKFQLWATDGAPDKFRIKIWWETAGGVETVVYDNGVDQTIGGGSIVVHTGKKK
jgi:hypothetical protein